VIHPWECGNDNSPAYDHIRDASGSYGADPPARADIAHVAAEQRPRADDYRFYWGLLRIFQGLSWSQAAMAEQSPCQVADLTFNCVWARANADLAALMTDFGRPGDAATFAAWAERTRHALRTRCWSETEGFFFPLDLRTDAAIPIRTSSAFLTLMAGVATPHMAATLVDELLDRRRWWGGHGIPSLAYDDPRFDPRCYWRGPAWQNVHYLIDQGLRDYGYHDVAAAVADRARALVDTQGFREYYDPLTGEGLGAQGFAWSTLALVMGPPPPHPAFHKPSLVRDRAALADGEAATVYNHPDEERDAGVELTSICVARLDRARQVVGRRPSAPAIAGAARAALNPPDRYPRLCDGAALTVIEAAAMSGLPSRIHHNPLHYFAVAQTDAGEVVIDPCADQFAIHPASRMPLLVEHATLALRAALTERAVSPVVLSEILRALRHAVGALWVEHAGRRRWDRHARAALRAVLKRHAAAVEDTARHVDVTVHKAWVAQQSPPPRQGPWTTW
jgi:hypothetical protein